MGSKAHLSCLWTPTRQSFAPSLPWFQLFSCLDKFSKAGLLFVIVSKCEQAAITRGAWEDSIDSTDTWKSRSTVLVRLPSSSVIFPRLAGLD